MPRTNKKLADPTVLQVPWTVADETEPAEEMERPLVGADYPHLCGVCRSAIDAMAGLLRDLPDEYAGDLEGPMMAAYDYGLLCGGHDCTCQAPEPTYVWMTVQVTEYLPGWKVVSEYWESLPIIALTTGMLWYDLFQDVANGLDSDGRAHLGYGRATAVVEGEESWTEIVFMPVNGTRAEFERSMAEAEYSPECYVWLQP